MKKIIVCFLALILSVSSLAVFANAAQFTDTADMLREMGLFIGTGAGYELDRAPTRAEAAVMLTRLLGKEAYAKTLEYKAPFTDVPEWARCYIQYLYDADLTKGTSVSTYSPNDICTAQMYATFLLRSLGYRDTNGDFLYAEAINFAKSKNVITDHNYSEDEFLRDNVVAMSYSALFCETADKAHSSLLRKLINDGAVSGEYADATADMFDLIRTFDYAAAPINSSGAYHIKTVYTTKATYDGAEYLTDITVDDLYEILNEEDKDSSKAVVYTVSDTNYARYGRELHNEYTSFYKDGEAHTLYDGEDSFAAIPFENFRYTFTYLDTVSDKLPLVKDFSLKNGSCIIDFNNELSEKIINRIVADVDIASDISKVSVKNIEYTVGTVPNIFTEVKLAFSETINGSEYDFEVTARSELLETGNAVNVVYPYIPVE